MHFLVVYLRSYFMKRFKRLFFEDLDGEGYENG